MALGGFARSRYVRNPAAFTLLFLLLTALVLAILVTVTEASARTDEARRLVRSPAFGAWDTFAAISVVAFGDALLDGIRELRKEPLRSSPLSPRFFAPYFAALVLLVMGILSSASEGDLVPIDNWSVIARTLVIWGAIGASPWVIAVWSLHAMLTETRVNVGQLAPASSEGSAVEDLDAQLRMLRAYRRVIGRAVGRLLVIVLAAVLMSGALRTALVGEGGPMKEEDFPASAVLMYGAFFTGVLATAVVPLMMRWRELARRLVERAYPSTVRETSDDVAARQRMLAALEVNGALFTFPVTLTALLAPLVTSLLSVYVPQLGK
jgi:hypothetical protein